MCYLENKVQGNSGVAVFICSWMEMEKVDLESFLEDVMFYLALKKVNYCRYFKILESKSKAMCSTRSNHEIEKILNAEQIRKVETKFLSLTDFFFMEPNIST